MTIFRQFSGAVLLALCGLVAALPPAAQAQNSAPVIRNFSVDQVPQLVPGTELIFRVGGTAAGKLQLDIDGVSDQLGLVETRPGIYEGAYTIGIRDLIRFDSKARATLRSGNRQTSMVLAQTLLTDAAHAQALAAASPKPQISSLETRNSGAFSGGHELVFTLTGTPGGTASVSFDGGRTSLPLAEQSAGSYGAAYTVKIRDQLSASTPVQATLQVGNQSTAVNKPLAAGVLVATPAPVRAATSIPTAAAAVCDDCGVVQAVNKVQTKGKPNFVGAIAGGVAGAALGNQVGKGDGRTAATLLGAIGGAFAGREIEKNVRSASHYEVVVRMDDGANRTFAYEAEPVFAAGSRVKVRNDALVLRD